MNDLFWWILVAKIEVSISIFLAPKISTVYRRNWKSATTKSYAYCVTTVVDPRLKLFDNDDVWQWEWALNATQHVIVKAAEANAPVPVATLTPTTSLTPAVRGAGDLCQTVCHCQYQHVKAMHVNNGRLPTWT